MLFRRGARIADDIESSIARPTHVSIGKSQVTMPKRRAFSVLADLTVLVYAPCKADVPAPVPWPSVPAGCSSMYDELSGDLLAFNTVLATPPFWTPI